MKKSFSLTKKIGRKNVILSIVALILVMLTAVATTYSWIEEVSEIKFNTDSGQETPLHITSDKLKSTAIIQKGSATVDLKKYFYESGDFHLSPCLSDGEKFYFPKKSGSGYRLGTKDDANVNYISATFKVRSMDASTAYWFEKIGSNAFFTATGSGSASNVNQYLRCSVTVDNATTVYVNNPSQSTADAKGTYLSYNGSTVVTNSGARTMQSYSYDYTLNQGGGTVNNHPNYHGNTLFKVGKYDSTAAEATTKVVTIKIWLEYNSSIMASNFAANLSNINLQLSSSWAKTRKITLADATINQYNFTSVGNKYATGTQWLKKDANNTNATLHWGFRDLGYSKHWDLKSPVNSNDYTYTESGKNYTIEIPAVYNGEKMDFFRCQNGWNTGNSHSLNGATVSYWDLWETEFPDTFCDETYTVYNKEYATWNSADVHNVYMVNSAGAATVGTANNSSNEPYTGTPGMGVDLKANQADNKNSYPYSYMWDSTTTVSGNVRVVQNGPWFGKPMISLTDTVAHGSRTYQIFAHYFSSDYDRIIFNDGVYTSGSAYQYQTQDLWVSGTTYNNKYFDMATLEWFDTKAKLPDYSTDYMSSNIANGANIYANTTLCYNNSANTNPSKAMKNTNGTRMVCKVYNKSDSAGDYFVRFYVGNKWWGNTGSGDWSITPSTSGSECQLYENQNKIKVHLDAHTVYTFYILYMNNTEYVKIYKGQDGANGSFPN